MTYLVERLAELARHTTHLRELRGSVTRIEDLETDLSLHNDVLFSLLTIAQLVIDIAGELSAERGLRFDDYTSSVRNLASLGWFRDDLVTELARLPGFRNILVHEYVGLDLGLALRALDHLDEIEEFRQVVADRIHDEG